MTTVKISGMTCGHCVGAVTKALGKVPGVEKVIEVNLESGRATVAGSAETSALIDAVRQEGYKAEVVK